MQYPISLRLWDLMSMGSHVQMYILLSHSGKIVLKKYSISDTLGIDCILRPLKHKDRKEKVLLSVFKTAHAHAPDSLPNRQTMAHAPYWDCRFLPIGQSVLLFS